MAPFGAVIGFISDIIFFISESEEFVAFILKKVLLAFLHIIFAVVVFPVPGGP